MRRFRFAIFAATAACVLLIPSSAWAQIDQISFGQPQLGLEGATVVLPLTVQCQPGYNLAFGFATVAQSTGHKLAQGSGSFFQDFPGLPCTGSAQTFTLTVSNSSSVAFKKGRAAVSAEVTVFNPSTNELITESGGPEATRIRR